MGPMLVSLGCTYCPCPFSVPFTKSAEEPNNGFHLIYLKTATIGKVILDVM